MFAILATLVEERRQLIDVSLWIRDEKSRASGPQSKFWLFEPDKDSEDPAKYLFKVLTEGTGGHWAGFVASKVGARLGFHTAEVELAKYQGVRSNGVLTELPIVMLRCKS
ncbi:hypothetical protein SLU01_13030 [Sporosarcina luteola]|uniref:Uncharacterized protein n=1 Tax=Sporosarcina luteola TaxID=582850 RepID=A0A511Z6B3_9BACL|nr:hypothetical protein SLU01_13030 [Sporosarcina luteola]